MHGCSIPTANDTNEITLQLPQVFGNELISYSTLAHALTRKLHV